MQPTRKIDYTFTKKTMGIRRPRFPERRLVESLIEAYLESGATQAECVKWAIECYEALNLKSREAEDLGDPIPLCDLKLVRRFAVAACRSGAAPFTAATRAVGAFKELGEGREKLHGVLAKEEERELRRKKGATSRMPR
jgi:hypothetical protein